MINYGADDEPVYQQQTNSRQPDQNYDGHRFRKAISRRWCDHRHAFELYTQARPYGEYDVFPQNVNTGYRNLLPCFCYDTCGINICAKFIAHKNNKFRSPTKALAWQPDSLRVVVGDDKGNITLFNGLAFSYEFHISTSENRDADKGISDLIWTHSGDFLITVDSYTDKNHVDYPTVKIWQSNYNNIEKRAVPVNNNINQLSVSPNDRKFAMCSADSTVKIWDLATLTEEGVFNGHGEPVRTVDWHPSQSLVCSGGKDSCLKFFDPRENKPINALTVHRNVVTRVHWNPNGNLIASCGRDSMVYITDVRTMTPICECKGHENDVFAVRWHPIREDLLVSAGYKGDILWWTTGSNEPIYQRTKGHNKAIFQLKFNPMGTILASTGHEGVVKFWVRNQPGTNILESYSENNKKRDIVQKRDVEISDIPGLKRYNPLHGLPDDENEQEEEQPAGVLAQPYQPPPQSDDFDEEYSQGEDSQGDMD